MEDDEPHQVPQYVPHPAQLDVKTPDRKNRRKVLLCRQALYISDILFISVVFLSHRFLRIFKRSYIHSLKLGFANDLISLIGLIYLIKLNVIHLRKSLCDVVYSKCCL